MAYVVALVAVVVGADVLFFKHHFWPRLMVNVGMYWYLRPSTYGSGPHSAVSKRPLAVRPPVCGTPAFQIPPFVHGETERSPYAAQIVGYYEIAESVLMAAVTAL